MGHVLVCAPDADGATRMVSESLGLPRSKTVFEVSRVKGVYQISRKEVLKHASQHSRNSAAEPEIDRPGIYELRVSADVLAYSESMAWRRLASTIVERGVATGGKMIFNDRISDLEMHADRRACRPKESAVEKQGIYKETRFFAGGAARPR